MPISIRQAVIDGNIAYIPLTRGFRAIIDLDDLHLVERFNWRAICNRSGHVYAVKSSTKENTTTVMHRIILNAPVGLEVDHISGDGLDNRRENIRIVTKSENMMNRRINANNASGYKGVYKDEYSWRAEIKKDGKKYRLGSFRTPEEAHAAYCEASKRLHGQFGRTE